MEHETPQQPSSSSDNTLVYTTSQPKRESMVGEIMRFSLVALLIVLPIRIFIAQPFIVSGASMETTFSTGQYLIVDQITYHLDDPKRGDVIVFRYPKDPTKFFIKRVIGLPGDTVSISGRDVTLSTQEFPNGKILNDTYTINTKPSATLTEKLGDGEYFVMGDNRDASSDSRSWGVLPRKNIVGRAFLRLFPFSAVSLFPGAYNINAEMEIPVK